MGFRLVFSRLCVGLALDYFYISISCAFRWTFLTGLLDKAQNDQKALCVCACVSHPAVLVLVFLEDVVDGVQQLLYGTGNVSVKVRVSNQDDILFELKQQIKSVLCLEVSSAVQTPDDMPLC